MFLRHKRKPRPLLSESIGSVVVLLIIMSGVSKMIAAVRALRAHREISDETQIARK